MRLLGGSLLALSLASGSLAQNKKVVSNSTVKNFMADANYVTVELPSSDVIIGSSTGAVDSFKGIPYADPPIGELRFKPPRKLSKPLGTFDATGTAPACPQMPVFPDAPSEGKALAAAPIIVQDPVVFPSGQIGQEDCLSITVQRPSGTKATDKFPVLFYIYGGGFAFGSTNQVMYDATKLIQYSQSQGKKIIFVAVNYRVAGFGFMPGAEILKEGSANAGLLDQRMGLEWVADNIKAFGGDPDNVTIAGTSAGAISCFDQLLLYGGNATYKGKSLIHGAWMNSGSATPTDPLDSPKGQAVFNTVLKKAGCVVGATNALKCLREKSFAVVYEAINSLPRIMGYNSLALSYLPRSDGKVLPASPEALAKQGKIHKVPMVFGDQEDEGTIFSLAQIDLTTTDSLVRYLNNIFFSHATPQQVRTFVDTYPTRSSEGSPFRTGFFNDAYYGFFEPGFKRVAALLGDIVFTLARRLSIEAILESNPNAKIWSFLNSYGYGLPLVGTHHGSDVDRLFKLDGFAADSVRTYILNFIYNHDPNIGGGVGGGARFPSWPQWTVKRDLLWTNSSSIGLLRDDFRNASYNYMKANTQLLYF